MKKRIAEVRRKTKETDIHVKLNIDGKGDFKIKTGIGFLDHMLELFTKHGLFDMEIKARGDLEVDIHHTNEDIGILLGEAFKKALLDKKRIKRFGTSHVPMDGSLVRVSLDISGRSSLYILNESGKSIPKGYKRGYSFKEAEQFLRAFVFHSGINLNIGILSSDGDLHHIVEAIFKALGRALDTATQIEPRIRGVMSTKGCI